MSNCANLNLYSRPGSIPRDLKLLSLAELFPTAIHWPRSKSNLSTWNHRDVTNASNKSKTKLLCACPGRDSNASDERALGKGKNHRIACNLFLPYTASTTFMLTILTLCETFKSWHLSDGIMYNQTTKLRIYVCLSGLTLWGNWAEKVQYRCVTQTLAPVTDLFLLEIRCLSHLLWLNH